MWHLDSYPLAEEIGDPELFVGRKKEMARLMKWAGSHDRGGWHRGLWAPESAGAAADLEDLDGGDETVRLEAKLPAPGPRDGKRERAVRGAGRGGHGDGRFVEVVHFGKSGTPSAS